MGDKIEVGGRVPLRTKPSARRRPSASTADMQAQRLKNLAKARAAKKKKQKKAASQ